MLKLRELRENNNLLQKELAAVLKRTTACISLWEKGKTEPSLQDLKEIADFFRVSIDELLGRENYAGNVQIIGEKLTDDEEELITLYRQLSFQNKNQLKGFAKGLISYQ